MDAQVLADQQEITHISSVWPQEAVYQERWMIGTDGEEISGKSMLSVQLDLDDDIYISRCALMCVYVSMCSVYIHIYIYIYICIYK